MQIDLKYIGKILQLQKDTPNLKHQKRDKIKVTTQRQTFHSQERTKADKEPNTPSFDDKLSRNNRMAAEE